MLSVLLLWVFVLFLPTQLSIHFWPDFAFVKGIRIDYLAPAIYFTDFLLFLLIIDWIVNRGGLEIVKRHFKYILFFVTLAGINIVFSEIPLLSLYRWLRIGEGLLLYLYIKNQKNLLNKIKTPFLLSLIFILFLSILQIFNRGSVNGIFYFLGERAFRQNTPGIALTNIFGNEYLRPYATFPHPNALGGYALISFFIFAKSKGRISILGQVLSLFLVVFSFSQNAWAALLATPVIVFVIKKLNVSFNKFLVPAVVASFLLTTIGKIQNATLEVADRVALNREAGRIIAVYPLLGAGAGVFVTELSGRLLQPVHNIFLLVASEVGILGLLLFVYFIFKNVNKYNLTFVVAIVLLSMWDHYFLTIIQTSLLFFIVLGYNAENDNISDKNLL